MAQIPSELQQISTDVPGVGNVQAPTATAAAVAHFGQTLESSGTELLTQVKQAEAQRISAEAYYSDIQAHTDFLSKLKLQSPDGYIHGPDGKIVQNDDGSGDRTISQEYRDWANDRFQQQQDAMPNAMAQGLYRERALAFYSDQQVRLKHDQLDKQVQASDQSLANRIQQVQESLFNAPSIDDLYARANDVVADIRANEGRLYPAPEGDRRIREALAQMSESLVKGARDQIISNVRPRNPGYDRQGAIDQWRTYILGYDPRTGHPDPKTAAARAQRGMALTDMLNPDQKAKLDREILDLTPLAKGRDLSDFNKQMQDTEAQFRGGQYSSRLHQILNDKIDRLAADDTNGITPLAVAHLKDGLMAAAVEGQTVRSPVFAFAPPDQKKAMIQNALAQTLAAGRQAVGGNTKGTEFEATGQSQSEQLRSRLDSVADAQTSASQTDYSAFALQNDKQVGGVAAQHARLDFTNPASFDGKAPIVGKLIQDMKATYAHTYPTDSTYYRGAALTKEDSKKLADSLKDPGVSAEITATGVKALAQAYGKEFPDLMNQMIKDGNLHEGWRWSAMNPSILSTADVVGALKGRDGALMKNYDTYAGTEGKKQLEDAVRSDPTLKAYITASAQQNPNDARQDDRVHALSEVVKTKAMQLYTQSQGTISISDAVARSSKALISDNGHIIGVGGGNNLFNLFGAFNDRTGSATTLLLPKQMAGYHIGDMESQKIQAYLQSHISPDALKGFGVVPPAKIPGGDPEHFYKQAAETGRWQLAPNAMGFKYQWYDKTAQQWVDATVKNDQGHQIPLFLPVESIFKSGIQAPAPAPSLRFVPQKGSQ